MQSRVEEKSSACDLLEEIWNVYCKFSNKNFEEVVHCAAKEGNVEFLNMIHQSNPDLLYKHNRKGQSILHVAVLYRQEKVFRFICEIPGLKDLITLHKDDRGNNILHLAAMTATTGCKNHDDPLSEVRS